MHELIHVDVVRLVKMLGLEAVLQTKKQEMKLQVAELKMLKWSLVVTTRDRILNHSCNKRRPVDTRRLGD